MQAIPVALAVVISSSITPGSIAEPQQPPAATKPADPAVKRDGWWIRISQESKAERITWQFSTAAGEDPRPVAFTWRRGNDPDTFDLPERVRVFDTVSFSVRAEPAGAAASFCVFYAAQGVQLITLPPAEKITVDRKSRDKNCVP